MSGVFFEYPGVRFSRRVRLLEIILRAFASLLLRRATHAARHSFRVSSRPEAAEFPAATQTAFERLGWTLRGSRAGERASIDALRPNYNSVNTEDLYGISIIREKFAAPTGRRRFPQKGRRSPVPAKRACEGTGKENVLAESHGIFHQRKSADRARRGTKAQWFAPGACAAIAQA